jgi:hypothetical protein
MVLKKIAAVVAIYGIIDFFNPRMIWYNEKDSLYYGKLKAPIHIRLLYDFTKVFRPDTGMYVEVINRYPSYEYPQRGHTEYKLYPYSIKYTKTVDYWGENGEKR